jgi:MinD-like ATPase involved in chromosome partitioning or flagellar assembly
LLERGGANEVVPDTIDAVALVQAIRFVAPSADQVVSESRGRVTAVAGSRGAPGCTEVALAYASVSAESESTVLIDADLSAPALAVRLGLPPRPDLTDAADGVRGDGSIGSECLHRVGRLSVITGSHRPAEARLRDTLISGVIDAASAQFAHVVLDIGADHDRTPLVEESDDVILVVSASAVGIVRAAQVTSQWLGPQPTLVLNRVDPRGRAQVVEAVRRWTGLEPAAVIPDRIQVRRKTAAARMPDRRFTRAVAAVGVTS